MPAVIVKIQLSTFTRIAALTFNAGEDNGVHFLVLELVDGLDMSKILRCLGRLEVADACEIVRQTALGLDYAHSRGIIHRDVKPSNLMLDRAGRVKILDFGLAQFGPWNPAATDLTTVGQLLGTLDYMAPEQASQSAVVDHRADVYSLGATLFAFLCGRPPYAATPRLSPLEKLRLMATELPPRVQTLREDLPVELASFVSDLMDRAVDHRPASAAHAAEQIAPFCIGHDLPGLLARVESAAVTGIVLGVRMDEMAVVDEVDGMDQGPGGIAPNINAELPLIGRFSPQIRPGITAKATTDRATTTSAMPPRRRWPVVLALASFAAFAALGIWLIIETRKGQLVIETDSADVRVKLLANGKQYDEMELHPGANTTRLFAGEYEIEIASGSDRYTLDKNQITVRRGDTIDDEFSAHH